MVNPIEIDIAYFKFGDAGIQEVASQDIDFLRQDELVTITNYYSLILNAGLKGKQGNQADGLLFGPLPVAYHHDKLVYLFSKNIKDPSIQDSRVKKNAKKTISIMLIFFPVQEDRIFTSSRSYISKTLESFFKDKSDISQVTNSKLDKLRVQLVKFVFDEKAKLEAIETANPILRALERNITFLNSVGESMGRPIRLGIFGTLPSVLYSVKNAVKANFQLIETIDLSRDNLQAFIRLPYLIIEVMTLQMDEQVNPNKMKALANKKARLASPSSYDGVMLNFQVPVSKKIPENIKQTLDITPKECPLSIVLDYEDDFTGDINDIGISQAVANAEERTISLMDTEKGKNYLVKGIIDLVEKIIPIISHK